MPPDATAIPMPDPAPAGEARKTFPPSPDGSMTSCSIGPPALLLAYRLLILALSLLITIPTLIPHLRDTAPMSEAYRYAADLKSSAAFYSTWSWFLTVAFFGCASVASLARVHTARLTRRREVGGGEARTAALAASAAAADATAAAATAAALLHAAFPAAAFITYTTFWVVLPSATTQEAWWEVAATIATPLGLAASGGGLAALALDVALSRARAPRPVWLLLTTAWPAAFLAGGAVASLVGKGRGGGGLRGAPGAALGDPTAATAAPPPAASTSEGAAAAAASSLWTTAAAYSLGATLLAHLAGAALLGCVVVVREGCCAAGAAVVKRAKRA